MSTYVQVVDDDGDEPMELPTEPTGELLLTTLVAQFPGVCGLKYRPNETGVLRGLRLSDGKLIAPVEGWSNYVFLTVYPKVSSETMKRKADTASDASLKMRKVDNTKCSDLIVLGLPWKSTEEDIRTHFSAYGELSMVQLKFDVQTKQSKGFGFIRFSDYESQVKALSSKHMIDGRWCNVRVPNSKIQEWNVHEMSPSPSNKIYVGRLSEDLSSEDLEEYFSRYGEVREVFIPKPFRAFAFVTFADPHIAQSLYGDDHIIKNNSVHIGTATPKSAEKFGENGYEAGGWSQSKGWMKAGSMQSQMDASMMPPGMGGGQGNFGLNQNMIAAAAQAAITQGILGMMGQSGYPSDTNGKAYPPSSSKTDASHAYSYGYQSAGYPSGSHGGSWGGV